MNVFWHELKSGFKAWLFWTLGIAFLTVVGVMKFEGVAQGDGIDLESFIARFPRVVLAIFGMVDVQIGRLPDYFTVIVFLCLICLGIYAVSLGHGAVTRETADRTDEFLFSRPRSRTAILAAKLSAAVVLLIACAGFFAMASIASLSLLPDPADIRSLILRSGLSMIQAGLVLLSLSACLGACLKRPEKAILAANLVFLILFILAVLYDLDARLAWLRPLTPLKYVLARDLLESRWPIIYTALSGLLSATLLAGAIVGFGRRDLISH